MFSGIVEEEGKVQDIKKKKNLYVITISAKKVMRGTKIGDSISVDGVCLTVTKRTKQTISFDVMKESLDATILKYYQPKRKVNLERALKVSDRIGGHFVSGHVDGVGVLKKKVTLPNYVEWRISIGKKHRRYIVPKGSVCVDGVSLTVGVVTKSYFAIYLIPHTLDVTTFGNKRVGAKLNIETDMLAKYVLNDKETM